MNMKKGLKIILIIVLVLIVIIAIYMLRNYIIISKISNKQKELANKTNYYYKMEFYTEKDESSKEIIEHYYKDGKKIQKHGSAENECYLIEWYDEKTGEEIIINTVELTASVSENRFKNTKDLSYPDTFASNTMKMKLEDSINYYISSEEINGKKCYKLKPLQGITSTLYYINMEDGTLARVKTGIVEGNEDNIKVLDYIEYKFDELTDEDFKRPDLTGYEVTYYNEDREVIDKRKSRRNKER